MTDPSAAVTVVTVAPIIDALSPLVNAAVQGLVIGIGGLIFALLAKWTGIAFSPDYQVQLEKAAATEAGKAVAAAADNLSKEQIDVRSPVVAHAVGSILSSPTFAQAVSATGMTPERLSSIVAGEFGKLQAGMTEASAPPPKHIEGN